MMKLPDAAPKHRLVVSLRLAGYTSTEVSLRTGYNEGSVRQIFSRVVRRLSARRSD